MVFWRSLKGVSEKLHGCFKKVTRKIELCFLGVLTVFQGCFLKVWWKRKFNGCFKGVSWFSRVFPECSKEVSRKLSRYFKKVSYVAWHSSQLPEQKEGLFFLQKIWNFVIPNIKMETYHQISHMPLYNEK